MELKKEVKMGLRERMGMGVSRVPEAEKQQSRVRIQNCNPRFKRELTSTHGKAPLRALENSPGMINPKTPIVKTVRL